MANNIWVTAAVLVFITNYAFAQDTSRCDYMVQIPRPQKPELPDENVEGLTWTQRPLLPVDPRDDVCMDTFTLNQPGLVRIQNIYMEEEIEGEVPIAKLNYNGNQTPYVLTPLLFGSFNQLGPVIRRIPANTGDWYLVITNRQDYETPGMQRYVFEVRVNGETAYALVTLIIVNIDDNSPIIHLLEPCSIPENSATGVTTCKYNVSDADGEISMRAMYFTIDNDRSDEQIFKLLPERVSGQSFWMNMVLSLNRALDFVENPLHIFRVTAYDSLPNTHTVTMMVEVENVESRPPRWVEFFAVQQFDEKTYQTFKVRAIDADTGINKPIYYRIETAPENTFFRIETIAGGNDGAVFFVDPIDRDTLQKEMFDLKIIAYKYGDKDVEGSPSFETAINVIIIVNDVNDQIPQPLKPEYAISIREETAMTLDLEDFGFHDRDLGQNAQYKVHLESEDPPGAEAAFYIAPEVGYQRQNFIIGTRNHRMLDYEVPAFQNIKLRVVAIDMNNTNWVGVATININLINWNDELPIFERSVTFATFEETVPAGYHVGTVRATDRDIDDRVEHSLLGNAADYLRINKDTGDIYVSITDAFDYHRQNELFVQIRADDTLEEPYNTATSQLVIRLQDINNTPPTLRLPRGSPQVQENVPEGFLISQEITATDPDTTAELRFEIDWETSYATKQGRETPPREYHNCVEIETLYPNENNYGNAVGRVIVKTIRDNVTIDFEEFEVLYLTVRVRDLNTVLNQDYDESTFTIMIIDMNDNWPVWASGTLTQQFRVREMANSGVVIGSVLATDIDGPDYNQVRYSIYPREDTPENLVTIDAVSGQITVDTNQAIDADVPPRYNLYYSVIASDRCINRTCDDPTFWDTPGDITIQIIDTNNKIPVPEIDKFNLTVYIYENATTGDEVVQLVSSDLDRDEIYHRVSYQINYAVNRRLRDFFEVDLNTGRVYVYYTTDEVLDRDGDEPQHRIFFNLIDNFLGDGDGNRNQADTEVLVVLLDVNDNAPELPPPEKLSWSISENLQKGVRLQPDIYAPDRDEPDTDNSRVGYAILDLSITNREIEVPELFTMIQIRNVTGELETAMDLRGYWGTYNIHIQAYDHGIPQQKSDEVYELVIRPYNFHRPGFQFPLDGSTIRLSRERAVPGGVLVGVDNQFLDRIHATDEDGLLAGTVTFSIVGDGEAVNYFNVINEGNNYAMLQLTQPIQEDNKEFTITLRGTDGGTEPGPLYSEVRLTAVFVPTQGSPVFSTPQYTIAFIEQEAGLSERFNLPLAVDPKNHLCFEDCYQIFYSIVEGNADGYFGLDPTQNIIYLVQELNRAQTAVYTLVISASNSQDTASLLTGSTLTVTVNVREADPRPVFEREIYTAGISTADTINRELLTVRATHTENLPITYSLNQSSMVMDPSLEAVRDTAFTLNPSSGVLTLNMQPTASMQGMFEFNVIATDPSGASASTEVKIYLISAQNRVFFLFLNTLQQIEANRDFIAQTFSVGFSMTCNIDQVVPASNNNGVALDDVTEVRAHFVRNNVPVAATEIERLRSDTALLRSIQLTLSTNMVVLQDLVTGSNPAVGGDAETVTFFVLLVLTVVLAILCLVLLITFVVKTRALNRRLEALSMTKYGSVDSGLNRVGLAAPGTNKHAVEGSNPIWNESIKAPDFDTISDVSNDSDLIGIEDLPQFRNDYFPPADNNSIEGILPGDKKRDAIASHNNNFGFNVTPFSTEFANNQFRR